MEENILIKTGRRLGVLSITTGECDPVLQAMAMGATERRNRVRKHVGPDVVQRV